MEGRKSIKKRIFILTALVLIVVFCFSLSACSWLQGKSAYEIACDNGFVGTEQEWLKSLEGNSGKDGKDGVNGQDGDSVGIYDLYDAYCAEVNADATFEEFLNSYLSVDYYDASTAAAKGIQSAVSVYCTFQKSGRETVYTAGSGVIYRINQNDVYIITNYHVVYYNNIYTAATKIDVFTYGLELSKYAVNAQFIGGSITKDIAVLKTSLGDYYSNIKAADLTDSNDVSLGERVVAIGNPSAKGTSITSGIICVDSENIDMTAIDSDAINNIRVIRTDTAINSGNSGGGLYNMRGQLLGIVNAKSIATNVENIGYAIPVSVACGIADNTIDNNAKKCLLGIEVTASAYSTQYNPAKNRVEIIEEISVHKVTAGALAYGKLLDDDKLVSARIGDKEIQLTRIFHLSDFLYNARVGGAIYLTIERGGAPMTVELVPAAGNFVGV